MRCFVAAWPPDDVLDRLDRLPRPDRPDLRWTTRDQWHVTLRFLGDVDDPADVATRLAGVSLPSTTARVDTEVEVLSAHAVVLPVAGLDELAEAVHRATADVGAPVRRPFRGHLTLARARGRRRIGEPPPLDAPGALGGDAAFAVGAVALVRSHLEPGGARYETVAEVPTSAVDRP